MRFHYIKFVIAMIIDLSLAAAVVGSDYFIEYRMPHSFGSTGALPATATAYAASMAEVSQDSTGTPSENTLSVDAVSDNKVSADAMQQVSDNAGAKFANKFSDTVISTDTEYKSPDISIELSYHSYDSGVTDGSENGKHVKYGTMVSYVLADVYIKDVTQLQTHFAMNTYGAGYMQKLPDMSAAIGSVFAVNGDSYSNNRHKNSGTIIRNGIVYRAQPANEETCVLYRDGSMKIFSPQEFDPQQAIRDGAWQTWVFGPGLLDENGHARSDYLTWDYIRESHPRTAIGYYEPGHYCFLVADGRKVNECRGMYLQEMGAVFETLGCKAAYNLDGGQCAFMTMGTRFANSPYKPENKISDCIAILEPIKTDGGKIQ